MKPRHLGAVVVLCALAAGGIVTLLVADSFMVAVNLGYTAAAVLLFSLTAAAGLTTVGGYPLAWVGWLCVLVSITGFGLTMGALWEVSEYDDGNEGLLKAAGSLFFFSLALAYISLALSRLNTGDGRVVRTVTIATFVLVLGVAALLTVAVVAGVDDELYFRLTAVIAVLAALGTALVPVLRVSREA